VGDSLARGKNRWHSTSRRKLRGERVLAFEPLESRRLLALTHWYTFNSGAGEDLVGDLDVGIVNGATVQSGQVVLSNNGVTSGQAASVQYINMPATALPASGPLTVVTWFTASNSANWTRVFDFGNRVGTNGDSYLFFSPQSGLNDSRLVLSTGGGAANERIASTATSDNGAQRMLAAVVDTATDTLRLYLDGTEVATAPLNGADLSSITKSVAYFGRSIYDADPGLTGSINEIRIYDEALSATTIAEQAAAGPATDEPEPPAPLPARQMEDLNRGVIALRRATSQVYVGWRMLGTDPANVAFNLYRSANGGAAVKLNPNPLTQTTDYVDSTANMTLSNAYFVRPIIQGIELAPSESYTLIANAPVRQYLNIPIQRPAGGHLPGTEDTAEHDYTYNANDASVGDLDGDGQYEIILKWDPSDSKDNSQDGYTGNHYVDAYKLDGTLMWRIDLGRNVRAGAHYLPFTVYDFDGDGKAEVIMRTAEATVAGDGTVIGNANADYRNSSGYILSGPEYLTVFEGETGAILDSEPMFPQRGSVSSWGDSYGNRVDRFQQTVAYLDLDRPSLVIGRGYAGPQGGFSARNEVAAFDYRDGQLTFRWLFSGATNGANPGYVGQSAHSITVGDVDGDGRDEIITGASAVDDDGTLLYNTGLGHGDALHLTDMDFSHPGLEVFMPHEGTGGNGHIGASLRDASDGTILFGPTVVQFTNEDGQLEWPDVGRGVAADIDPNHPGYEVWDSYHPSIYNAQGVAIYNRPGNMHVNHLVWWDADLLRETLDGTTVSDWNHTTAGRQNILSSGSSGINSTSGLSSNNGSKSNPALTADILGDWREEVIWRTSDNLNLRIYSTTIAANNRLTTLMHDSQYRSAISWQNSGYNQPPHPSFFLGAGMTTPPQPNIYLASANPTIPGDFDLDDDVDNDDLAIWQQTYGTSQPQGYLPGDADRDGHVGGRDFLIWQRNFGQSQAPPVSALSSAADEEVRDEAFSSLTGLSLLSIGESEDAPALEYLDWVELSFDVDSKVSSLVPQTGPASPTRTAAIADAVESESDEIDYNWSTAAQSLDLLD
jgi:hypothetical protein